MLGGLALLQLNAELLRKIRVDVLCDIVVSLRWHGEKAVDIRQQRARAMRLLPLSQSSCQYAARSFSEPSPGSGQSEEGMEGKGGG